MKLIKISDWSSSRNVFFEEGFSYEFRVLLNGGLKSGKSIARLESSDDPQQEIYEIENFIDDSSETITLASMISDNTHPTNMAINKGSLLYEE